MNCSVLTLQGKGVVKTFWLVNKIDDGSTKGPKVGMVEDMKD